MTWFKGIPVLWRVPVFLVILISLINTGLAVHVEATNTSNSACFGSSGPVSTTLSCDTGYVIAIEQIWVGAKPTASGCPAVGYDIGTSNDTSCCSPSYTDDCIFAFDHTNYNNYHDQCNGEETCTVKILQVQSSFGSCNATYLGTNTYGYVDYVCVDVTKFTPTCSTANTNITDVHTYVTSDGFPSGMSTSTSPCTCSVQADDPSATLQLVTIQRRLTGNSNVSCDQSVSLLDADQNSLVTWTCADNTYVEQTIVVSDYVIVSLSNNRTVTDGNFWLEIRASSPAASLMINCPAEIPTTTTSTTPTTTTTTPPTTTTTTTPTTTTSTPTTTTTTPATTTTTAPTTTTTTPTTTVVSDVTAPTTPETTPDDHDATQSPSGKEESSFLVPFIVCAALAGILALAVIALIYVLCRQRRSGPSKEKPNDPEEENILHDPTDNDEPPARGISQPPAEHAVEVDVLDMETSPQIPPPAVTIPVVVEQPRLSEQKPPVETSHKSINTDHIVLNLDDKSTQVTVSTSERGCHVFVPSITKGTNTALPAKVVQKYTQTKEWQTQKEEEKAVVTVKETEEIVKNERENVSHTLTNDVSDSPGDLPEVDVKVNQPQETEVSEPEPSPEVSAPNASSSAPDTKDYKRLKTEERSRKKKRKLPIVNNYVVPAPEPDTDKKVKEGGNETNKSQDKDRSQQTMNEKQRSDVTTRKKTESADEETGKQGKGTRAHGKDTEAGLDGPYKRIRKYLERGFYKSEIDDMRFKRNLKDLAQLKAQGRKKNKSAKKESQPIDSGIDSNSLYSNSSENAVNTSA